MKTFLTTICDKDGRNCKQVSELSTGSQITIGGDTGAVCTKEGDDTLKCTTSLASLTPGNGTIKITQGGVEKGSFNLNQSTGLTIDLDTGSNITVSVINGYLCTKLSDDSLRCSTNPENLTPGNGIITIKQGSKIMSFTLNQSTNTGIELDVGTYTGVTMNDYNTNSNNYCVAVNANTIECKSSGGSGGSGDSLRSGNSLWLYPKNENISVGIGPRGDNNANIGSTRTTGNIRLGVNGNVVFTSGGNVTAKFDGDGVALLGRYKFYLGKYSQGGVGLGRALAGTIPGVAIAGPIAIGYGEHNTGNFIYIYTDGTGGDNDRHYEIMGTHELAIGTLSGAFAYFTYLSGDQNIENNRYKSNSVGINTVSPNATLDVNGTIKVGNNCASQLCTKDMAGTIMYYETTSSPYSYVVICKKDGANAYSRYNMFDGSDMGVTPTGYNRACNNISPNPAAVQQVHPVYAPDDL